MKKLNKENLIEISLYVHRLKKNMRNINRQYHPECSIFEQRFNYFLLIKAAGKAVPVSCHTISENGGPNAHLPWIELRLFKMPFIQLL